MMKQKLLSKIADLHIQYPFISICFDPNPQFQPSPTSRTVRYLKSENENRLLLTVFWEDYIRYSLKGTEQNIPEIRLPVNIQTKLNEIKRENWKTLQKSINDILKTADDHTLDDRIDTTITIQPNTMLNEVTRNHFAAMSQHIMKHYNGMIEIFHTAPSSVIIRVHWNVYLSQIAAIEQRDQQVPLLTDATFDYLRPYNQPAYQQMTGNPNTDRSRTLKDPISQHVTKGLSSSQHMAKDTRITKINSRILWNFSTTADI